MISPVTHPNFFYTETVVDQEYFVPIVIGTGLWEDLMDAYHEAYRSAKAEECANGIDPKKYEAWSLSDEGNRTIKRAGVRMLFTPKEGALPVEEVYPFMTGAQIDRAFGFLPKVSTSNTEGLPTSIESGASNPATDSITESPSNAN